MIIKLFGKRQLRKDLKMHPKLLSVFSMARPLQSDCQALKTCRKASAVFESSALNRAIFAMVSLAFLALA